VDAAKVRQAGLMSSRRFEAQLRCQPLLQVHRRAESGDAPDWQGATTKNAADPARILPLLARILPLLSST